MSEEIDYQDIDQNLRKLIRTLNTFDGVETLGSCGGHENPANGQWPAGQWYVKLKLSKDDQGWCALEFLGWAINHEYRSRENIMLLPEALPPYLNGPGSCLYFAIEGNHADPNQLADFLLRVKDDLFITPEMWEEAEDTPDDEIDHPGGVKSSKGEGVERRGGIHAKKIPNMGIPVDR